MAALLLMPGTALFFLCCHADVGALLEGSKRQRSEQAPPAARQQQRQPRQRQQLGLLRPSEEEEQEVAAAAAEAAAAVETMPPPRKRASEAQAAVAGLPQPPQRTPADADAQMVPEPVLAARAVETSKEAGARSGGEQEAMPADGDAACAQAQAVAGNRATDTTGLPPPERGVFCVQTSPSVFQTSSEVQVGSSSRAL